MRRKTIFTSVTMLVLGLGGLLSAAGLYRLGTATARTCRGLSYPQGTPVVAGAGFPSNYPAARQAFLAATTEAGGRLESIRHPRPGPDGEAIFMDVASFGAENATRLLVISSGTHGVEGFAGSGVQTRLLREGLVADLPSTVQLLMIHAVNPYGMAYLRRANEDNVDLNRNFRDHQTPDPTPNTEYARLAGVIAPTSISFCSEIASWSRLLWYRATSGSDRLQAAVSGGQYAYPDGLFYGGASDTWSNQAFRSVENRYLANMNQVVFVDIHTGLGDYGRGEIILNEDTDSPAYQRALAIWGPDVVKTTVTGASVSPHLDATLKLAVSDLPGTAAVAVCLEFGTLPPMEVFTVLRAENWLHHHGGPDHPRKQEITSCLLKTFHPGLQEWEATVWEQSRETTQRALTHLAR